MTGKTDVDIPYNEDTTVCLFCTGKIFAISNIIMFILFILSLIYFFVQLSIISYNEDKIIKIILDSNDTSSTCLKFYNKTRTFNTIKKHSDKVLGYPFDPFCYVIIFFGVTFGLLWLFFCMISLLNIKKYNKLKAIVDAIAIIYIFAIMITMIITVLMIAQAAVYYYENEQFTKYNDICYQVDQDTIDSLQFKLLILLIVMPILLIVKILAICYVCGITLTMLASKIRVRHDNGYLEQKDIALDDYCDDGGDNGDDCNSDSDDDILV